MQGVGLMKRTNIIVLAVAVAAIIISIAVLITSVVLFVNASEKSILSDVAEVWTIDSVSVSLALNPTAEEVVMTDSEIAVLENAMATTFVKKTAKKTINGYSYALSIKSGNKTVNIIVYNDAIVSINNEFYNTSGRLYYALNAIYNRE